MLKHSRRRHAAGLLTIGLATALLLSATALPAYADQNEIIDAYVDDVSIYGPVSSTCAASGNTLTYDISVYDSGDDGPLHPVSLVVDDAVVDTVTPERDVRTNLSGTYTPAGDTWAVNVTIETSQGVIDAWGPDVIFECSSPDPGPTTIAAQAPVQTDNSLTIPTADGVTYVNQSSGEVLTGTITLTGPLTISARASGDVRVSGGPWTFQPVVGDDPTPTPGPSATATAAPSTPTPIAPTSTATAPATTPTTGTSSRSSVLAATGADDINVWAAGVAVILVAGGILISRSRRHARTRTEAVHQRDVSSE